jgi:hypothetical protein
MNFNGQRANKTDRVVKIRKYIHPMCAANGITKSGQLKECTQTISTLGARAVSPHLITVRYFAEIIISPRAANNLHEQHHP